MHRPDREPRAAWSNREPRDTWSNRAEPARVPETGSRRRAEDIGETWPELPDWATPDALDADARRDLRGLSKENAAWVAAHLVAAGTFADEDPETAWSHARAARARGGRIAVVRETVGLVAYRAGEWAEAIGELRAARRMGGGPGHLAVLADCERALGHPEKAIELARSQQAGELDDDGQIELATVVAGARADLGQIDAGLAHLEQFDVEQRSRHPRLAYAYADLLDRAGRQPEALTWFIRAANADTDEDTDALERVESLAATVEADAVDEPGGAPDTSADRPVAARPADAEDADPDASIDNDLTHDDGATNDGATNDGATNDGAANDDATHDDVTDDVTDDDPSDGGKAAGERTDAGSEEPAVDLSQVLFSDDPQAGDR
ncbi:hypothetical protein [Nakamurella sp.]|uniref:hypothetical protein n=1 Tax=Nakamurella sp. TaxID=1869182 RepID=UPI0037841004